MFWNKEVVNNSTIRQFELIYGLWRPQYGKTCMLQDFTNHLVLRGRLLWVTLENSSYRSWPRANSKQKIESTRTHKNRLDFTTMFSELEYIGFQQLFYCFRTSAWVLVTRLAKAVPLHTAKALGERGGIAPTHSRPGH